MGMPILSDPIVDTFEERQRRTTVEQKFRGLCSDLPGLQLIIAVLDKKGFGYGYSEFFILFHPRILQYVSCTCMCDFMHLSESER